VIWFPCKTEKSGQ